MILPEEHFWSHIAGSAACLVAILGLPVSSNPQVGDPGVPSFVEDDVLGFDVAVDDAALVKMVEALD